ncbi:MAG TPA: hypothetical protein VGL02_26620 [Streptomyces sp.]
MNQTPDQPGPQPLDERSVRLALARWIADPNTRAEDVDTFVAQHRAHLRAHPEHVRKPPPGPDRDWL